MKKEGYVIDWNEVKGTGQIRSFDGCDYFLHYSSLPGYSYFSIVNVKLYSPVKFDVVDGFLGENSQAHNIKYGKLNRVDVVSEILIKLLDQDSKDSYIDNIILKLRKVASEDGYLIYGPFWE